MGTFPARSVAYSSIVFAAVNGASLAVAASPDAYEAHTVSVHIPNARGAGSIVYCGLFQGEEGFPSQREKATWVIGKEHDGSNTQCTFRGIRSGEYAVAVLEDQDGDRHMDKNWFGVPLERWAVSKNVPPGALSGPDYSAAKFSVTTDTSLALRLRRTS